MKNNIIIYICDDEIDFIDIVKDSLNAVSNAHRRSFETTAFSDAGQLIETFLRCRADIVLLDIDMPSVSGFEADAQLQKIFSDVNIIFITAHEDKVFQSYEFHPFWFVRKSRLDADLGIALSRLFSKIDRDADNRKHSFKLRIGNGTLDIDPHEIIYIQAYKHYLIFKNRSGGDMKIRGKISEIEHQLSSVYFIRAQTGIIINCRFIFRLTKRTVVLQNNEVINISRDRLEHVKNEYQKFIRST